MFSDQKLLNLYYDATKSVQEAIEELKIQHKIETSEDTLIRHLKEIGKKTRKQLGIRKNKFGHIPSCEGCDYKVTECVCDGYNIAH